MSRGDPPPLERKFQCERVVLISLQVDKDEVRRPGEDLADVDGPHRAAQLVDRSDSLELQTASLLA